jgi:outer membrane protein assembly factor BamE
MIRLCLSGRKRVTRSVSIAFAALMCVSCGLFSVHTIEIQQGNYITQEMVSQLKPGLTKDQVRFVLGTPLVADIFHEHRWDYVYRRQRANSTEVEERRLAIFFEDGKLTRVEGDVVAATDRGASPAEK